MTWSKILSFIINLIASVFLWNYLVDQKIDVKLCSGIYAAYVLVYMFLSDLISKIDKGTALFKANLDVNEHKEKITKYERCMLKVHDEIIVCLRDNMKGAPLKHSLSAITMMLSAATANVENDPKDIQEKIPTGGVRRDIDEINLFISGQTRD